ncbi:unnamed protein product [Gongylonema pulchrum]|uniref:Uncharacterized protein n=1 Tax=Gongylonema pulchrum TaxID=637853 RepID=A0A3P6S0V0_9BILA|nr:unnamed protein product [Gongylonema pulchrum]
MVFFFLQDESEDELMKDELDDAEQLNFDFEAYPIVPSDKESLINLLTQIFLRAGVDVEGMADVLVEQAPFGCVYRPAEEFLDDDNDEVVYGVLSMLELASHKVLCCYIRKFQLL